MMERNERLKAANACASMYSDENEAHIAKKAFMDGCEFEGQGEIIKGQVLSQPSLPSNLDEAAEKYSENILANNEDLQDAIEDAFKAGAEWYDNQMKMPNSSELISAWRGVKSILQEKDFRGDEWRLAYNAFMFGFSKGLNTRTKKK